MPATATDVFGALLYAASHGFHFERMPVLRQRALEAAGLRHVDSFEAARQPDEGRGNIGLFVVSAQDHSIFQKITLNTREFRIAERLSERPAETCHPRVLLCASRGPILHIFQEYIAERAEPVPADTHARIACDFSRFASAAVADIAPSRLDWFEALTSPRAIRALARETGDPAERLQRRLAEILAQPRAVIHNDLHGSNIRRRADGTPVVIDFGGVGWSLRGGEFHRLLPRKLAGEPPELDHFNEVTALAADRLGMTAAEVRSASWLGAAARQYRRARQRRDSRLLSRAMAFAAHAL